MIDRASSATYFEIGPQEREHSSQAVLQPKYPFAPGSHRNPPRIWECTCSLPPSPAHTHRQTHGSFLSLWSRKTSIDRLNLKFIDFFYTTPCPPSSPSFVSNFFSYGTLNQCFSPLGFSAHSNQYIKTLPHKAQMGGKWNFLSKGSISIFISSEKIRFVISFTCSHILWLLDYYMVIVMMMSSAFFKYRFRNPTVFFLCNGRCNCGATLEDFTTLDAVLFLTYN